MLLVIFDLKNDCFHLSKDLLPAHDNYNFKFACSGSGSLYGISCLLSDECWDERPTEVRSFKLRNDKLVENGGVKWKCSKGSTRNSEIESACFV